MSKVDSTKLSRNSLNLAVFTYVYKDWEQKLDLLQWSQLRKTQQGRVEVHWQGTGNSVNTDWHGLGYKLSNGILLSEINFLELRNYTNRQMIIITTTIIKIDKCNEETKPPGINSQMATSLIFKVPGHIVYFTQFFFWDSSHHASFCFMLFLE